MHILDVPYSKSKDLIHQNLMGYVEKLALLQEDWDGYGACAIDKSVVDNTVFIFQKIPNALLEIVGEEGILPTPNGTITIEWHKGSNELMLEVGEKFSTYYIQNNSITQKIENQFIITNSEQMNTFKRELKQYFSE